MVEEIMQYAIDTLSIEIGRLQKTIRKMRTKIPVEGEEEAILERAAEFEGQIREMRKAIGVLKNFVRENSQYANRDANQYNSSYLGTNKPNKEY
jgi:hypothetical protein